MIQAIIKKGKVFAEPVPAPVVNDGFILIKVINSCISAGTELSGVSESNKSLITKLIEQPEKISKAIDKIREDGVAEVYKKVKEINDKSYPTGYSISGVVIGVGKGINKFKEGDKVAAAGAGYANHAEYVNIPENLVVKFPEGLDFVSASTVTLGAIAMQGIRRANLNLGEFCVVFGTGILGLLTVQMLKIAGIRIIAVDLNESRLSLAKEFGAELIVSPSNEDLLKAIENFTGGYGADAVLFTAATNKSEPLSQAFKMCKKKGRVILVGVAGMEIKREDLYAKELELLISTSYGPGRYDKYYEEKGYDYPYHYVRWTENRNMEEYLRMLSKGFVKTEKMISKIYPIEKVFEAFETFNNSELKPLLIILDYGTFTKDETNADLNQERKILLNFSTVSKDVINVAIVGLGGFANNMHLPNLQRLKDKFNIYAVMDRTGYKAKEAANKYSANFATTDFNDILTDQNIDLIFICTRHDSHAELTLKALKAGKNVFVEKPLATNIEELEQIKNFYAEDVGKTKPVLMVGFNRRFSKYAQEIKKHTDKRINPLFIHYRMNAGFIPFDHWVHEHGGRIVGEACHIIDLMSYFTESKIKTISYESLTPSTNKFSDSDNKSIILKFEDGSVCTIEYLAVGSKEFPKEYMEIHFDEKTIVLDDYKLLKGFSIKINELKTNKNEKGHLEELLSLYDMLTGSISNHNFNFNSVFDTTMVSLMIG
ncbi:MAG: bi-domain-containing oxidoreductase [Ignavibacteriaceae bacterium]